MPIDPYTPCPGGTGKKIKFCCSDLISELDKVQRMLEGEQRAACLEYIDSLESKFPERACLLSIKAMLQAQLGHEEKADATLSAFMTKHPDNPVALAEAATLKAGRDGGEAAVGTLQDALEKCGEQIPPQVYDAIGLVAQSLVADGLLLAARAHLVLQLSMGGTKDKRPVELLMRLNNSPAVPLLTKQDMPLLPCPDDALWKNSFNTALAPAMRGAWRLAARNLVELAARVGDWPVIWHNVAVLRGWLGDTPGAVESLHKYAVQDIPLDDAVEAEALAQLLDADKVDQVDVLTIPYGINEFEPLLAHLAANPRSFSMPIDLARMGTPDDPPPKGAYWLLDRGVPESGKEISREQIPQMVGQVYVFGKQTDRAARLELVAYRTELAQAKQVLSEVGGDALGAPGAETITTHVPAVQHVLGWNWRLPDDTPPDHRLALMSQHRREILLNRWPDMPQQLLGGKSAREAARDPAHRIRLLGAILLLELSTDQLTSDFDFNELRAKLDLPPAGPIDPNQVSLADLPLARLGRVDVKQLSDEALVDLYRRADHFRHISALRKLAHEIIARPSLDRPQDQADGLDKAEVYGILAQIEPDTRQAIAYLEQARKIAEASKTSTAPWDLAELTLRIARGEVPEADRLLHHIRDQHIREPGVAQALFQILTEA
ncbi:MAG TPA: hypothetical protein VGZ26_06610, partial [Pirellulales bacterium]|nr:hypothetical protein [Pirellulales bacterium]